MLSYIREQVGFQLSLKDSLPGDMPVDGQTVSRSLPKHFTALHSVLVSTLSFHISFSRPPSSPRFPRQYESISEVANHEFSQLYPFLRVPSLGELVSPV